MNTINNTNFNFPGQKNVYKGKVREVYNIGDEYLVMIARLEREFGGHDRLVAYHLGQLSRCKQKAHRHKEEDKDKQRQLLLATPPPTPREEANVDK